MIIEAFVGGELYTISAAESMHKVGIEIRKIKERITATYGSEAEVVIEVDGVEKKSRSFALDVKTVAKNMKTSWMENKIMGDLDK